MALYYNSNNVPQSNNVYYNSNASIIGVYICQIHLYTVY